MFNSRRPAVVELMITFLAESKSVKAIRENLTAYSETVNRIDVNTANMFGFADESREDILFRLLDPEHRIDRRKESDPVSAVPEVPENSVPAPSVPTASEPSVQSVQSVQSGSPAVQERRRVSCSVPLATWDMLFVNVCVHA